MAKIDRRYEYLGLYSNKYNHKNKEKNVTDSVSYMLNRTNIMFKYHDLPDSVPARELEKLLQCNGFAIICKIDDQLYAVNGSLGGETDVYNNPTIATVSIPYLKYNETLTINEDCVVIKNDTLSIGLLPLYYKYCTLLNENEITMLMCNIHKRVQSFMSANTDATYESATQFVKKLYEGELSVIADEQLFSSFKVSPAGNITNNLLRDLYEYHQYLKASLFNEVGLASNYNMKKERLTTADIQLNSDNLYPLVDDMLENRRNAIEKINELFNTDIKVELNSSWDYRILNGESIHNLEAEKDITEIEDIEPVEEIEEPEDIEEVKEVEEVEEPEDIEDREEVEEIEDLETLEEDEENESKR